MEGEYLLEIRRELHHFEEILKQLEEERSKRKEEDRYLLLGKIEYHRKVIIL